MIFIFSKYIILAFIATNIFKPTFIMDWIEQLVLKGQRRYCIYTKPTCRSKVDALLKCAQKHWSSMSIIESRAPSSSSSWADATSESKGLSGSHSHYCLSLRAFTIMSQSGLCVDQRSTWQSRPQYLQGGAHNDSDSTNAWQTIARSLPSLQGTTMCFSNKWT